MDALVPVPKLLVDPDWERAVLGPWVDRARRALFTQLATGVARLDVRGALGVAYRRVPFYQARFASAALGVRDLADPRAISMLAKTTRGDLATGVERFLAHPVAPFAMARGWLGRTSGSTGEPVVYLRDPRTHAWFWAFLDFALAYAGRRPDVATRPNASPRVARNGARSVVLLDALAHMPEYDAELPLFHGARFAKRSSTRPDLAAELARLSPCVITGDPESLAPLARLDLPPAARPDLVLSSAFALPSAQREAIADATSAAVLEYYATQETSVVAIGCREGRGFHPLSSACLVETMDHEGGTEIVVTPTHNPSFVLVRYAPGDFGTMIDDGPCPCGLAGPRIASLDGRTHVRFHGARGPFAAGLLGPLLARLPAREHELVQRPTGFVLRYRAERALEAADVAAVERRLVDLAGPTSLALERVEHLPRATRKPMPFRVEVP